MSDLTIDGLVFSVKQLRDDADEIAACGAGNEAMCMRWAADEIERLTRELAEATRERDLLAYHVAPHTDEAFRSSHCAEQIIDAGLQARQDARDKALEAVKAAMEEKP